jgi:hypothetical protein
MRPSAKAPWLAVLAIGFLTAACTVAGQVAPSASVGPAPMSSAPAVAGPTPTASPTVSSAARPEFSEAAIPKQGVTGVPVENVPVVFEEAGLPGGQVVSYELTADASASYQCWNPTTTVFDTQKSTVSRRVTASATLTAGADGTIRSVLQLWLPLPDNLSCSMGFRAVAHAGTYDHVLLADTTNDVRVDLGMHQFMAN